MYPLKFIVLIQVLPWLVFTCEIQTSEADKSQRTLLRDYFQKSLINDSEKLLTLQQAFLTPRQKYQNGLYLYVYVTVEGRITDTKYSYRYLIDDHCSRYLSQNNLCVYQTSMKFELIPPDQDISVKTFLTEDQISMVLEVLDPSFHLLARLFQILDTAYYGYYGTLIYDLEIMVDNVEIMLNDLQTDVRNALYLTLSWVSLIYSQIK